MFLNKVIKFTRYSVQHIDFWWLREVWIPLKPSSSGSSTNKNYAGLHAININNSLPYGLMLTNNFPIEPKMWHFEEQQPFSLLYFFEKYITKQTFEKHWYHLMESFKIMRDLSYSYPYIFQYFLGFQKGTIQVSLIDSQELQVTDHVKMATLFWFNAIWKNI